MIYIIIYIAFTLHLHYHLHYIYITFTLHLHYIYITFTLHYITFTLHLHYIYINSIYITFSGPVWLNELGSWIIQQLIQAYHQYGVGSRPAL